MDRLGRAGLLLVCLAAGACGGSPVRSDRPVVVVSVLPQAWFVEQLAGDLVEVEVMIPPGASPATHEPTIEQLKTLARASLYIKVGHPSFPFEKAWLDRLLLDLPKLQVVDGSQGLADQHDGHDHAHDPHLWLSPRQARPMLEAVAAGLKAHLPGNEQTLDANLARTLSGMDELDRELRQILDGMEGRTFLVFHPAWGAFADEYDLRQLAIEQDGKEPDPATLGRLLDEAAKLGVTAVFVQPQFNQQSAAVVARELGVPVIAIDPLARDWAENLRRTARLIAGEAP